MIDGQSASVANLFAALAAVQAQIDNVSHDREVEVPIKDRANPGQYKGKYRFRYATLPGILTHIRKAMTDNGLWYTQRIQSGFIVTRIYHQTGEWMDSGDLPMPDIKGSPQDAGSIISYFKRYSLTAALGLAAEDDEDGKNDDAGEREIHVRARGNAPTPAGGSEEVDEPEQGWGDWARGLLKVIGDKNDEKELDALRDTNKRLINACKRYDATMYADIGKAFQARRAVVSDEVPF